MDDVMLATLRQLMNDLMHPALLKIIFNQKGIVRGRFRKPSRVAFVELASCVRHLQILHATKTGIVKDNYLLNASVHAAIGTIVDILPELIQSTFLFPERLDRKLVESEILLNEFLDLCRKIQYSPFFQQKVDEPEIQSIISEKIHWNMYQDALASAFIIAMSSTNPEIDLGISNAGPLPRFVTAMIPLITGDNPSELAVARSLQRARKLRKNTVPDPV